MSDMERALDWDDSIEKDGGDFILLPEGDYDFKVEKFERARHSGSAKLPACNKAILTISIEGEEGTATLIHNLFLHTKTEGMLSAFFSAIGLKKKGEKVNMNWTMVPGSTGRCKVGIRNWTNSEGKAMQSNEIKKFYAKEEKTFKAGEF